MGKIVFMDGIYPGPYDIHSLTRPMARIGGTEGTLLRIADKLSKTHEVYIAQRARKGLEEIQGIRYLGLDLDSLSAISSPDAVVVLRKPTLLRTAKRLFRRARLFLWMHDQLPRFGWLKRSAVNWLLDGVRVVGVSMYHRQHIFERARPTLLNRLWTKARDESDVVVQYNPIADDLTESPDYDPNKLMYLSAPFKGLDKTLKVFSEVRRQIPELKLYITNPGYHPDAVLDMENVTVLGNIAHSEVMGHLRTSLCLFCLNTYPENFGIVFAESHALGVPVLTTPLGSAPEVVADQEQLTYGDDVQEIVTRLRRWRSGQRPKVQRNPNFCLTKIVRDWEVVLGLLKDNS